jgi:putative spermidine/putrescine transport system substrate-binding protein
MQTKRFALFSISCLMVIALFLAACSPAQTATQSPTNAQPTAQVPLTGNTPAANTDWNTAKSAADGGGMDALVAAAKAEGELNVITLPPDWCNYGELITNFTTKYGIKVNSINPNGGSADEVQAIKDNMQNKGPQAPDVLDIGPAYGPLAKGDNLLAPYKVTTWDTIKGTNDPDGYFFVDYSGIMVLEINSDQVKNIPQDIKDLLDPQYKGQIALSGDPRASNQAAQEVYMAAIAMGGSLDNIQPGLDFMKKLNDEGNLLPLIAKSGNIAKGEVGITFEWSWNAFANKENFKGNPNIAVVFPKSVNWGGYYYQAISAYAPHPAAARLWEEYLYSDEGQLGWVKGYCAPARLADLADRKVITPDLSAKLPDPKLLASAIVPNPDQLTKARAEIKDKWDATVANFPTK